MSKYKLKYKEDGECVEVLLSEELGSIELNDSDRNKNHKQPFLSEYRLNLIKEKTSEILSKRNYVFGLASGWQKDQEYKDWCEEVINFSNSFENQTIEETQITFPADPWGYQEVLDL